MINVSFAAAFLIQRYHTDNLFWLFGRLYFAASKMFHQFFFEFAWNWSSVLTGYNDE